MPKLTFTAADLAKVLADAEQYWPKVRFQYGETHAEPGFWIVGDEGVYIMHNGAGAPNPAVIAYAVECNPKTNPNWYDVKRATFGGDDGLDYFPAQTVRDVVANNGVLTIAFTSSSFEVTGEWEPVGNRKAARQ